MKIGDRVIVNGEYAGLKIINEPGKIIAFVNGDVCVEFGNYMGVYEPGYCWFVSPEMIRDDSMKELRDRYEVALYYYKQYKGYWATFDNPKEEFYKKGLDYWQDKVINIRKQIEVKRMGG